MFILLDILLTLLLLPFVFTPEEFKLKKVVMYLLACAFLTPIIGAPFFYYCLKK